MFCFQLYDLETHVSNLCISVLIGSAFLCSVLVAPVKNEEGIVVMYIVNHEDVTWSPNRDDVVSRGMNMTFL